MSGTVLAADSLLKEAIGVGSGQSEKELALLEELATQCARALRNLSVNRKSLLAP